jgi:hypothetical protein
VRISIQLTILQESSKKKDMMTRRKLSWTFLVLLTSTTATAFVSPSATQGRRLDSSTSAIRDRNSDVSSGADENGISVGAPSLQRYVGQFALTAALAATLMVPTPPALADGQTKDFKFPPIDYADKSRCVITGSSMGQANAARDKLYDLRECQLEGVNAQGYDLSGVIMTKTDMSNANLKEAYFSKGYLRGKFVVMCADRKVCGSFLSLQRTHTTPHFFFS